MTFVAGIDLGSRTTKAVLIDSQRNIRGLASLRTLPDFNRVAREALFTAVADAGIDAGAVRYVATTGFGRTNVSFRDIQITDITCGARAAAFLYPSTTCVLDVGCQSTRATRLDDRGKVRQFRTNDKCAAGAGGFIERAAHYLEVPIDDIGRLSLFADGVQPISSVCAVLAESEIISHMTDGASVENILRGVHVSLATRALALLKRVDLAGELTFIGGVARQAGMVKAIQEIVGVPVNVPVQPEMVVALGAAILGLSRVEKVQSAA